MKQKYIFLLAFVFFFFAGIAHEFWLSPQRFFYTKNEIAVIKFSVGEGFMGENWKGDKSRIIQLIHVTPSGQAIDLKDSLSLTPGDSLKLFLSKEGTNMIYFNSTNSFISLDPKKFNAYVEEDGLQYIKAERKKYNEENKNSNEYYQRSVKTILQVGNTLTDACTKPTSLPLDIIPLKNPYRETKDKKIPFLILFKGKPLPNYIIKIWSKLNFAKVSMQELRTDSNGKILLSKINGKIMVSAVYMERIMDDAKAQWQSYWGSCTFENR